MAKRVNVSYESLRQEGREEVLDWLVEQEIINYSQKDNKYFVWDRKSEWLRVLPWGKDLSK